MSTVSVGRIVHYKVQKESGACLAAVVTEVHDTGNVNLLVFGATGGTLPRFGVEEAPEDREAWVGGQWHWPERTE